MFIRPQKEMIQLNASEVQEALCEYILKRTGRTVDGKVKLMESPLQGLNEERPGYLAFADLEDAAP